MGATEKSKQEPPRWRPEVLAFADAMEAKLKANDHKRHWRFLDMRTLSRRLTQEREELRSAVERGDPAEVLREAADVANFCMMTADMVRRYPKTANVEMTGAARLHRAASSDRRERGRSAC